jgi:hypothetical protein
MYACCERFVVGFFHEISQFVVGFGSCVWDWRGKRRRSNAVEGWGECVVEELGAMTARSSETE